MAFELDFSTAYELAGGNPGSLGFIKQCDEETIEAIKKNELLRGGALYVLHSDLCGKDMDKVKHLLKECPADILADACSRQDYSGRELVKAYLPA